MGYWQQIGEDNRRMDAAEAAQHPLWRGAKRYTGTAAIVVLAAAAWAMMLIPLARWVAPGAF